MTVAAELAAADQSESGHIQLPDSRCRQNLELTVHDDMVSFPKDLLVLERQLRNGRGVFPICPVRPVLPEVDTVPQLLDSERAVAEHEIITALGERGRVVVRVREHHNVVLLALSQEEMVGSLTTQARWLVRIGTGNFGIEKTTCPRSNSVLVLWTIDRDRQNTVRDVIDCCLPVPP